MEGWIKLHRSLLDWEWYSDGDMVRVFLHLLLCAAHDDMRWQGVEVKRGQVVVSQNEIAEALHVGRQVVRTCLGRLKKTGEITAKGTRGTNGFTIVTILNYGRYQGAENANHLLTNSATICPTNSLTNSEQPITDGKSASCEAENKHANQFSNHLPNHLGSAKLTNNTRNNNIYNNKLSSLRSDNSSDKSDLDFDRFMDYFNSELEKNKSVIPHLQSMTPQRKNHIRARCREYGKKKLAEAVQKAAASGYLNGNNNRGWVATFAWFIRPNNFLKVLEGNYDNKTIEHEVSKPKIEDKRRGTEVEAVSAEDYKTSF